MSWDVMIFNTRSKAPPPLEQFEESDYPPLGPAAEVRQRISALLPGVDWTDTTCGIYQGDGFSIEFNVDDDPIENMMLYVRGSGDAISQIATICQSNGWSALDCTTSEFLDLQNPSQEGWKGYQSYCDKVLKKTNSRR